MERRRSHGFCQMAQRNRRCGTILWHDRSRIPDEGLLIGVRSESGVSDDRDLQDFCRAEV